MTSVLVLAVAVLTFLTAALAFGTGIRNARKLDDHGSKLVEISVNTNGRLDHLTERVEQLVRALVEAGEPIPADPNGHTPEADERKVR